MAIICPTLTPLTFEEYQVQMSRISGLSPRIQIDLMDEAFAHSASNIDIADVWWPPHVKADIHIMYQDPFTCLETLLHLRPHMVIIHVETMVHHMHFAAELHKEGIKAGLALLPETPVQNVEQILHSFDHMLIFSGDLGHFGGQVDFSLATKALEAKEHHPDLEVGWDGGVNPDNVKQLAEAGIDVLNVGGYIQNAADPADAYKQLIESLA